MGAATGSQRDGFLILDRPTIAELLDIPQAIAVTADALRKTASGAARQDVRRTIPLPGQEGSCLSVMYGVIADRPLFGAKVLSVLPGNFEHGLPSHRGAIVLFDRDHGRPAALLDAGEVTAWRTAAASAVATHALSRQCSSTVAVLGYGEQALRHVLSIAEVRPIRTVRVWGRDDAKARRFAEAPSLAQFEVVACRSAAEAVDGADVVCTTTSAATPVLFGDTLRPGMHINAVGASVPSCRELDVVSVQRSRIWVDSLAMAWSAAGELIDARAQGLIGEDHLRGEIGSVLSGAAGRERDEDITMFRSLGLPAEDLELANLLYRAAIAAGAGQNINFGV